MYTATIGIHTATLIKTMMSSKKNSYYRVLFAPVNYDGVDRTVVVTYMGRIKSILFWKFMAKEKVVSGHILDGTHHGVMTSKRRDEHGVYQSEQVIRTEPEYLEWRGDMGLTADNSFIFLPSGYDYQ